MSRIEVLAERIKLARLFGVQPESLAYLQPLDAAQLHGLRQHLTDSLFDSTRASFQRVATASKLLPNALVALIGEKIFGPMLCARISGLLPPDRTYDIALKLPDHFLADVSVELDPRSAREVIARMPAKRVASIAAILLQRQDFVTMGRFVDYLSHETIRHVIEGIRDDAALLKTAFFVENKATINALVGLLPLDRIRRIVVLAGDEKADLWTEGVGLMSHVDDRWKKTIGDLAAEQDESVLGSLARTAQRLRLWDSVLPVVGCMSEASQRKLARLPELASREVLASIVETADARGLWSQLLPLVGYMGAEARRTAAQIVEHLPREMLVRLIHVAGAQNLWVDLIGVLGDMDADEQGHVVRLIGEQDASVLAQLLEAVDASNLWERILPMVALLEPAARRMAAEAFARQPDTLLRQGLATLRSRGLLERLLPLATELDPVQRARVEKMVSE